MSDAETRLKLLDAANGAFANVGLAEKRVLRARSELGTAEAELDKAKQTYAEARAALLRHLPEVP